MTTVSDLDAAIGGDIYLEAGTQLGVAGVGLISDEGGNGLVFEHTTDDMGFVRPPTSGGGGGGNCFASGTHILTTCGDVAVENLKVGDLVVTALGEARQIQWLGHRRLKRPAREQWPVRVMAGAFGETRPVRELRLSPGHAVCVSVLDEVFVPVGELINGATIAQVEVSDVTYCHIELESHDVLMAEGLPCESYMDAGNRSWFGREYARLGEIDPKRVAESLTRYARPFVNRGPVVAAVRERLTARAETLGWTRTTDMDLHLVVDGQRLDPEIDGGLARFIFPASARDVRLISRTFVPERDLRSLGVRVEALRVADGLRLCRDVPLDEIAGFHPEEAAAGVDWRWADGDLPLPADLWADCRRLAILTLALKLNAGRAWIAPEGERFRAVA